MTLTVQPVAIAVDRSLLVESGQKVVTGYVNVFKVRLGCRERMAIGDIDKAYQRQLQLGSSQMWPPPVGHWEGDVFVIQDGRHQWVAAVALGMEFLFVAWIEEKKDEEVNLSICS